MTKSSEIAWMLLVGLAAVTASFQAHSYDCGKASVARDLEAMRDSDQASRGAGAPNRDQSNSARLAEIVDHCGWPKLSDIGRDASLGAFLVLQHSDIQLQTRLLPLLRSAAAAGELVPGTLPLLEDRVLIRHGRAQRYGTQLNANGTPYPIEDMVNLDGRRKQAGLMPFSEYLELVRHRR